MRGCTVRGKTPQTQRLLRRFSRPSATSHFFQHIYLRDPRAWLIQRRVRVLLGDATDGRPIGPHGELRNGCWFTLTSSRCGNLNRPNSIGRGWGLMC